MQGVVVVHPTAYDGCVELASLQLGYAALGFSTQEVPYKCAKEVVKTHLVQARVYVNLCFHMFSPNHLILPGLFLFPQLPKP